MKSFLPAVFRPNRQHLPPPAPSLRLRDRVGGLREALQDMARKNLDALLAGTPPVAPDWDLFRRILDVRGEDPMAGYRLADWRAGKLPDEGFVTRLLHEPGRSAAIATLQTGLGSELLLPPVLHMAFTDGALRHEFAQSCRRFLSERVLFHPGPPPQPLFSPAAIAVLCLPQPRTAADGGQVALRDAMRQLLAECCLPPLLWDQWLYRRMDGVSGWHIDEDLAALPWVAWRSGDPLPDMAAGADAPAYWPNLIALDL